MKYFKYFLVLTILLGSLGLVSTNSFAETRPSSDCSSFETIVQKYNPVTVTLTSQLLSDSAGTLTVLQVKTTAMPGTLSVGDYNLPSGVTPTLTTVQLGTGYYTTLKLSGLSSTTANGTYSVTLLKAEGSCFSNLTIKIVNNTGGSAGGWSSSGGVQQNGTNDSTAALNITTTSLPDGQYGAAYSQQLKVTGGKAPYYWSVSSGSTGPFTLSSSGLLSGSTATTSVSSYTFTVKVRDTSGQTDTQSLTLNLKTLGTLKITTTSLPDAYISTPYTATIKATGGRLPYYWTYIGAEKTPPHYNPGFGFDNGDGFGDLVLTADWTRDPNASSKVKDGYILDFKVTSIDGQSAEVSLPVNIKSGTKPGTGQINDNEVSNEDEVDLENDNPVVTVSATVSDRIKATITGTASDPDGISQMKLYVAPHYPGDTGYSSNFLVKTCTGTTTCTSGLIDFSGVPYNNSKSTIQIDKFLAQACATDNDKGIYGKNSDCSKQVEYSLSGDVTTNPQGEEIEVIIGRGVNVYSAMNQVQALQRILNKSLGVGLVVDGKIGSKTRAAVMQFQKQNGLVVDGKVGPMTIAKLNQLAQ